MAKQPASDGEKKPSPRTAKKPLAFWNKPLKVELPGLFKVLAAAVATGFAFDWVKASAKAVEALTFVGFEKDPASLAWVLVRRSMTRAIYDLVAEACDLLGRQADPVQAALLDRLDRALDEAEFRLDEKLFDRPTALEIVDRLRAPLTEWLQAHGLNESQAKSMAARLPTYFTYALYEDWRKNPAIHAPIKEALANPFTRAEERDQLWNAYSAWLQRQVDERMFEEPFGLSQVYVPLRACFERPKRDASERQEYVRAKLAHEEVEWVAVDLAGAIDAWREAADPHDAIRFISGGPGSGKSSFARMYAARLAGEGERRVLFIPLHQFDLKADLAEAVDAFCRDREMIPEKILDAKTGEPRLLVLFDGLDELSKQGKLGAEIANDFLRQVEKKVESLNDNVPQGGKARLLVLLGGRPLAVQAHQNDFRKPGQILHALPYHLSDEEQEEYVDVSGLLAEDQRQVWWQRYGQAAGRDHPGMPEVFNRRDLDEITAQPLLNYLVALSYERKKLDFSREINLNRIYADLLEAVHEGTYQRRQNLAIKGMELRDFERLLEEIGLATWHGDGRTTTVAAIQEHCQNAGVDRLLKVFEEEARAGVTRLLVAFFFHQHGQKQDGEKTFEFTHKTFGEYLTARRIIGAVIRMEEELATKERTLDRGWDERAALAHWVEVCGPSPLDLDLVRFLHAEVALRDAETAARWQAMFCKLIRSGIKLGLPVERPTLRLNYFEESKQAANAEEALLVFLNGCARHTGQVSRVEWPETEKVGAWLSWIQSRRIFFYEKPSILEIYIGLINFRNCRLHSINFRGANLTGADLTNANLTNAVLTNAVLTNADLTNADLIYANLTGANLTNANLTYAYPTYANLTRANLTNANLTGANLIYANLANANLTYANLTNADLTYANLADANLADANLIDADLTDANLTDADLTDAVLPKGFVVPNRMPDGPMAASIAHSNNDRPNSLR